jgi:hypothetical protein
MKLKNHLPVLLVLHHGLQLDTPYRFREVKHLLNSHGFAQADQLVGDLIEAGVFETASRALVLHQSPLTHASPAEWQPYQRALAHVPSMEADEPTAAETGEAAATPSHKFSLYQGPITNCMPYKTITVYELWRQICNPPAPRRLLFERIRATKYGSKEYEAAKKLLPYVTVGGIFERRALDGLLQASGLGVLDYDNYPDVQGLRKILLASEEARRVMAMVFISPSRRGLKVVVRLPPDATSYAAGLQAVHEWLSKQCPSLVSGYDPSGSDISRACFLNHDPKAWIHDDFRPQKAMLDKVA